MIECIKHYLKDEEYFISIYRDFIYFYRYTDIIKFSDDFISLKFNNFIFNIIGDNLRVKRMEAKELLISGNIIKMERIYETE